VLLTRAPLNQTSIATYLIPCDLHVLNTPPAFVLSQNQTLRKKFGRNAHPLPDSHLQIDIDGFSSIGPRASQRRAAHNSIFFLFPAFLGLIVLDAGVSASVLARPVLGHTVKELPSRGLKSRSGVSHHDRRSVSRPPSVVAAREASCPHPPTSTHFENFFRFSPPTQHKSLKPNESSSNLLPFPPPNASLPTAFWQLQPSLTPSNTTPSRAF
jgi:hypothetical protein